MKYHAGLFKYIFQIQYLYSMIQYLISSYIGWAFLMNIIALVAGFILRSLGHMRIARILSYISLAGISIVFLYIIISLVLW